MIGLVRMLEMADLRLARSSRTLPSAWALALATYMVLTASGTLSERTAQWLSDMAWTLAAGIAAFSTWQTSRLLHGRQRRGWQLFAIGCGAWLAGQLVWDWNELARDIDVPFPSIADLGFAGIGLAFVVGLLLQGTHSRSELTQQRFANLGLIACSLAVVFAALILDPIARSQHSTDFIAVALLECLGVLSAFLLAMYFIWSYRWDRDLPALLLVALGLLSHSIATLIYAHQLILDEFGATSLVNVGWLAAFGFQHWAASVQARSARNEVSQAGNFMYAEGWVEALMPSVLLFFIALALTSLVKYISAVVIISTSVLLGVFAIILAYREARMYARGEQLRAQLEQTTAELENSRVAIQRAEQQRAQLDRELQFAARSGGVGMWDWNLKEDSVVYSSEWKRQLGYEDHEFPNDVNEFYSRVHPDDRQKVIDPHWDIAGAKPDLSLEFRVLHRDGSYRWILANATILTDATGAAVRVLGLHVDITARKAVENALRDSEARYRDLADALEQRVIRRTAELTEAYRESQSFAYAVAHDLKAPLRAIDGFSHLLEESARDRLTEVETDYIRRVRRGSMNMAELIEGLLDYSRMEHVELRIEPLVLEDFFHYVLGTVGADLAHMQLTLHIDMPTVQVCADRQGLAVVVRNLLENACKFTRTRAAPSIEIGTRIKERTALIWIKDNGIGFEQIYHEKIFEIFQRLHHRDEYEGTGIGLALARKAMQRMKGQIWAVSGLNEGATFYLELPLAEQAIRRV